MDISFPTPAILGATIANAPFSDGLESAITSSSLCASAAIGLNARSSSAIVVVIMTIHFFICFYLLFVF